jgi:hypothetical protein
VLATAGRDTEHRWETTLDRDDPVRDRRFDDPGERF